MLRSMRLARLVLGNQGIHQQTIGACCICHFQLGHKTMEVNASAIRFDMRMLDVQLKPGMAGLEPI